MSTARHCKEISVRVLNDIGILAQLTKIVADKGINILAAAAWVEPENKGIVHLVTDDNRRAAEALEAHDYAPEEVDSVMIEMEHRPGMLSSLCDKIGRGGVEIHYLYVSGPVSADNVLAVVSTSDNARALIQLG